MFLSVQGNKSEKKKRRRGKRREAEGEGADGEEEKEEEAAQAAAEVIREFVAEDGTVMTIKEAAPVAQEEAGEWEEDAEEREM